MPASNTFKNISGLPQTVPQHGIVAPDETITLEVDSINGNFKKIDASAAPQSQVAPSQQATTPAQPAAAQQTGGNQ